MVNEVQKKLAPDIDYGRQPFEDIEINPYEVAVAAARYAREINDRARKYFGSEVDVQPRNLAIGKVTSPGAKIIRTAELIKDAADTPDES